MPCYIQFDEQGNIGATIFTSREPPKIERQISAKDCPSHSEYMVDINTMKLVKKPAPPKKDEPTDAVSP